MLYLIATPIGNLSDISQRAIDTINQCDYLLCEDTRHSQILLKRHGLSKHLKSYHKFNEARREKEILNDLANGKIVGLLSDAGTPGISDPATRIVRRCREENLPVSAIPGPCAAIMGITLSGFKTHRFQFLGFPPKKKGQLKRLLEEALAYPGTSILYESPFRVRKTLEEIAKLDPLRLVGIARELTKIHEECLRGTSSQLLEQLTQPKGEFVLLISGSEE